VLQIKDLCKRTVGAMILKEFEGLPGGRGELAASNSKTTIAYRYNLSIVNCKWFDYS